jgi:ATP synthase subunit 6
MIENLVCKITLNNKSSLKGLITCFFSSWFFVFLSYNFLGMLPYISSSTRQLFFNLRLVLPLWAGLCAMSLSFSPVTYLSHLAPLGSPLFLVPFLVVIETIRIMVRPITLSVRISANIRTGHIILGLVRGSSSVSLGGFSTFVVFLCSFYIVFEIGVCLIQSYIIILLPTLYNDEHPF